MHLIIGGAYQGKLDHARKALGIKEDEIYSCTEDGGIDFSFRCVNAVEEFVLGCVRRGDDAAEIFKAHRSEWEDSVLICRDIFCGVVPMGAEMRAWREATGRLCAFLASEAETVTRMFCGIDERLK